MKYSGDDLDQLLGEVHDTRGTPLEHPSTHELAAYAAGESGSEAGEAIQEHLARCRECSELVLDFAAFEADVEHVDRVAAFRADAGSGGSPSPSVSSGAYRALRVLAAALVLATGALTVWNLDLRQTIADLQATGDEWLKARSGRPVTLRPSGAERSEPHRIVRGAEESLQFVLWPRASLEIHDGPYELVLVDEAGHARWSVSAWPNRDEGSDAFGVSLLLRDFPSGLYRLQLVDPGGGTATATVVEEFVFEWLEPDHPDAFE